MTSSGAENSLQFNHAVRCWVKNIRSTKPGKHHVKFFISANNTVRDSYFFDGQSHAQESYGINAFASSANLIENNIFQYISVPMMNEHSQGNVYAYNYTINNYWGDGTWSQGSLYNHAPGNNFSLFEGNDVSGMSLDNYHGAAFFITAFRNRITGKEPNRVDMTVPILAQSFVRYMNLVGNVLGDNAYHTNYEKLSGQSADSTACNHSIYSFGLGGNCSNGGGGDPVNDDLAPTTIMRWGNYDTVNDATRFVAGEVPSGISYYPNPVPASQVLPASFYLSAKPAWFGSVPWPPIGPDVTGGSEPNVNGHNAKIPARRCFENVMGGTFSDTTARTFNAVTCYPSGGSTPTVPAAPASLIVN
jgi:hypothetical protein